MDIFPGLVQNAALLLSLGLVFDLLTSRWHSSHRVWIAQQIVVGLILGGIGIVVMQTHWELLPGLYFDTRSVLLGISGLFFGPLPTGIAMLVTLIFRLYQGGVGTLTGVSVILATGSLGLIWRRVRRGTLDEMSLPELYGFGLTVHLIMLALMFTLPKPMAFDTLRRITLAVLAIYPLATALLGELLTSCLRRERAIAERLEADAQKMKALEALAQERQLLRTLIDNLPDAIYAKDAQGRKTLANRADLDNIGLPEEEVLGKTDAEVFPSEIAAQFMADDAQVLRDGVPVLNREEFLTNARGKHMWQLTSKLPLRDAMGQIIGLVGIGRDITERKQALEALRAERDLVSRIMETSPVGIMMVSKDGHIVFANAQAERVLGLRREEIHQRAHDAPEWRITDYDGRPFLEEQLPFVQVRRTLQPVADVRHAIEWPDGRRILLQINAAPLLDEQGAFNGIIASVEDITAQVRAQEQLLMMQFAIDRAATEVFRIDADGRFIYVNDQACAALGYTRAELLTMRVMDIDPDFTEERWRVHWQEIQERQTFTLETHHRARDGRVYPVEVTVNYLEYKGQGYNFAFAVDITERKRAEEALRESEQRYRLLFEQMSEGFALHEILTDERGAPCDYRFLEINPAFEQLTGLTREQCLGKTVLEVLPNLDRHWIADYGKVALTGEPAYLEDYVPELEHYYEVWAYSPRPRQFATLVKDVTARRHQELERAALLEAEREQRLRAETLRDVTLALTAALDVSDVLMEILHQAQRLVPSTASNIALLVGDALQIAGKRGYAAQGQDLTAMLQPLAEFPINAQVVADGQPYLLADVTTDPRWRSLPETAWIRAHLSLPLRVGERVLGVLRLDSDQPGTFNMADVERLLPLARAAAVALENAQLYARVQAELAERQRSQAALEASERKFREMLENVRLFAVMLDLKGNVTFCNDFGLQLLSAAADEVLGHNWFENFIPPEIRAEMEAGFLQRFVHGDFAPHYENEILVAGGARRALIAWNNTVIRDAEGNVIAVASLGEDITAHRQAERALQANEAWLRSLMDSIDDVVFSLDCEQRHTAVYGRWLERMGLSPAHFLGRTAHEVLGPEAAQSHAAANLEVLNTGKNLTYEWSTDGAHFQTTLSPLRGPQGDIVGLVGVSRDITTLKNYQTQLQEALSEKNLMLSEIHHRIKNNLQIILGLLELQFNVAEDGAMQQMLRDTQTRIRAIALIHEQLYQSPGNVMVNAYFYFLALLRYLRQTYDTFNRGVVIEQDIADLQLPLDLAIPCGLIVNELVANALKHAFPPEWRSPDDRLPTIRVALYPEGDCLHLEVADNGMGLPAEVAVETSPRLGLRLIRMLTQQIVGTLHVERDNGTCVTITFTCNEDT